MSEVKLPEPTVYSYWDTGLGEDGYGSDRGNPRDEKLYSQRKMEEYAEQRVGEALKYVSDGARMYDLGTPDGHAIADFIDSYAEAQKLNK